MSTPLTNEVKFRIGILFPESEQEAATALLADECGTNLPFCGSNTPTNLNRIRFAALKLSGGDLAKLRKAVDLAKLDWRDLLVAAGFGNDVHAHEEWLPDKHWRTPSSKSARE